MDLKTLTATLAIVSAALVALTVAGGGGGLVVLQGEGSSFLFPQVEAWAQGLQDTNSSIVVNYNPTGSGAGQSAFLKRVVDFAGSDPPLSTQTWMKYRGEVIQMPVVIGMVVVAYNVPGVDRLNLTGEALAKIYLGEIVYWDDPLIAEANPGVSLPHEEIIVVHRSDSSGTTQIFTTYLHKAAPQLWGEELVGKTIDWPVDSTGRGIGGKGNQGVTGILLNNRYSIGYVEFAFALKNSLQVAAIENREGVFVYPSIESAQAAALGAMDHVPETPEGDWSRAFQAIIYAPGQESYPLTSWSFLLFYKTYSDPARAAAVKAFIEYINGPGQERLIEGYVPLPAEIREINLQAVGLITTGQSKNG